ncbi:MAG: hypothetical protein IJH40_00705 [Ruminococcus sp.]|uniref:hypothetical protein n=1 Tax=Ruminococcus sp. TaxID=41978 RepID=UPI0028730A5D|nr:hypothetical protein [Ruminococcus sp.]MBQ3284134.1 hypothetical protein [Ruminococcus sp.]
MRGFFMRFSVLGAVWICTLCLVSCTRVINRASDELRMYDWRCEEDNGCIVSLSFDDTDADLNIGNDAFSLDICGLCIADDDSLTICDVGSGKNYNFKYQLYGDRVELRFGSGVLELKKTE